MRLRLYHHADGARIAYREAGTGPPLALLHSALLTHREFEPVVEELADRHRVILPDLPLHGDSEDRPRHPYSPDWLAEVIAGFCREVLGPRPLVGGHEVGAQLLLHATARGLLHPRRLVLMPSALHRRSPRGARENVWRMVARGGALPGLDRALAHGARAVFRPSIADGWTVRGHEGARDLVRHAFADVGGNPTRARAWAKAVRRWPAGERGELREAYARFDFPVLLLWADADPLHPLEFAEEALDALPDAQLRVLSSTGFLIGYDDPVGVARELAAFCG